MEYRGRVSGHGQREHGQREMEVALVVASSDPAGVWARVRNLRTLGAYDLVSRPAQPLFDRYFDTPSRDLWRRRLAVRERDVDGERLLALKGEIRPREHLEIEQRDDDAARRRIDSELRARGVPTSVAALGVIQERDTIRERRALTFAGRTFAELALDDVTYRFGGRVVRLREVEVELEDLEADLEPFVVQLLRAVPELREWPYTKLATGAAIAAALERDELDLGPAETLSPGALDHLARRLASDGG